MAHPITYYREKFRPQYHFSPERNFTNDPCGLVHFDGEYHLFYQYNPFDMDQDPNLLYWGHAISTDLLHWRHMPLQLGPDENGGISTGCGVVDRHDTSGLFGGQPGLVLIYLYVRFELPVDRDAARTIYVYAHRSHRIAGERTRITYDVAATELAVDRRTAGTVYDEEFAQEYRAPLAPSGDRISLRVLTDWSSVETIANGGEVVISTLVFPTPFGGGIRVFARGGAVTLQRLRVHRLGSVWNDS